MMGHLDSFVPFLLSQRSTLHYLAAGAVCLVKNEGRSQMDISNLTGDGNGR
jgi:hypothetical protein